MLSSASPDNYSRLTEVEAWTAPSPAPRYDLALGATATASSNWSGWPASSCVNGDRKSLNYGTNGGWVDAAPANTFPDWLQVDFGTSKTINEVDVFTLQDNYAGSSEPTESMTFTQWGLTAYTVEYWSGSSWIQIPNASVTGNNKIWRKFEFSPINTSKIRVVTSASVDGYSRVTEVEAYGPADTGGSGNGVHWLVPDHLGTPRIILDQTGSLSGVKHHDYLPFGEELFAGTGGRTAAMGYTGDGVRQQFTSQERDVETGLDYSLARYYSSTQGRFTSVDPLMASGRVAFPQSWNRYSYVLNNPGKLVDPTGLLDDDPQTFSFTPCEWGTAGCNPVYLGTVTEYMGPAAPLSTNSVDPGAVSLNLKDLRNPVLAGQYVPTPDTMPYAGGHDKPDPENFTQISVGGDLLGVGFDLSATYDEFGNWYVGGGPSLGLSWPISASVVSGTTYDELGMPVYSEAEVANILQGPSTSVTAGAGLVANVSWNNPTILGIIPIPLVPSGGSTKALGVGTPQIGIGETWSFKIPGLKWNPRKSQ